MPGHASRTPTARIGQIARFALVALLASGVLGGCAQLRRSMYEPANRDAWQQPERVLATLALAEGQRVADIGSGGGYFTFRFAKAVGERGQVYAVDVDESMNALVLTDARRAGLMNVATVEAAEDDPRLPEGVDWVFTSNTYHHLSDRTAYFRLVRERYLRPGGRVAIVEFRPEATGEHATDRDLIITEMQVAGFELSGDHDWLERQWFGVFTPLP